LIRRTEASPQVSEMLKLFNPHYVPPDFQTRCGLRVSNGKGGQSAALNNPHAYNLYSFAEFVKTNEGGSSF
jgi:hypothetical protein